jgi:glycosyltransferase involved in cell wall biosynthesis
VIAGNDMGSDSSTRALVRRLGIHDQTTFTGLLRGGERVEALADATVVVYPSQDEIFGLVPLEALLCGTPAIVADDSGCGEVAAITGGSTIVPLGDVEAVTRAIAAVLANPGAAKARACHAAARVRRLYGEDVVCEQLESLYCELAAGVRRS